MIRGSYNISKGIEIELWRTVSVYLTSLNTIHNSIQYFNGNSTLYWRDPIHRFSRLVTLWLYIYSTQYDVTGSDVITSSDVTVRNVIFPRFFLTIVVVQNVPLEGWGPRVHFSVTSLPVMLKLVKNRFCHENEFFFFGKSTGKSYAENK